MQHVPSTFSLARYAHNPLPGWQGRQSWAVLGLHAAGGLYQLVIGNYGDVLVTSLLVMGGGLEQQCIESYVTVAIQGDRHQCG